jgi:hypothetical protein
VGSRNGRAVTVVSLDARRAEHIGGSEAAAVLGCGPLNTRTGNPRKGGWE